MTGNRALLMDIGNTRLKWAVLDGRTVGKTKSVTLERLRESGLPAIAGRLPRRVARVFACNVAGSSFATRISGLIGLHCGVDVQFAKVERQAHGVTNSYRQVHRLGVDRWVAMIGARAEFKSALCIVDAGTAVTIDVLDRAGRHLGGQIIPGLHLMADSLIAETRDIKSAGRVSPAGDAAVAGLGTSTGTAIRNGAMNAICGAIERAVRKLRSAGYRPKLILTGGDAARILKELEGRALHRPDLVLQGLAHMLQSEQ